MLIEEARWLGRKMSELPSADIFPMLDVGSGTDELRNRKEPWIDEYVFKAARQVNGRVVHSDILDGSGVDIVGDLCDAAFREQLRAMNFRSIFCSNLLEHLPNREIIAELLANIIPAGGYIIASCPYMYPHHPAPIDTMFRPNVEELAHVFPGTKLVCGEIVTGETYMERIIRNPLELVRLGLPFYKPKNWLAKTRKLLWLFKNFQATCVLLQKREQSG
jgi:hypothetical protein